MSVLKWLRESDPATFGDVPDAELARFAADWDPGLLREDPELLDVYTRAQASSTSLQPAERFTSMPGGDQAAAEGAEQIMDRLGRSQTNWVRRRQQDAAAAAGARADRLADAIQTISDRVVYPLAPQGGIARALRMVGDVSRGLAVDTMSGRVLPKPGRLAPDLQATGAALSEHGGELPGEERLTLVQRGIADAAQSVPTVAGAMALNRIGVPAPVAFGATAGATTAAETGDAYESLKSATIGALIPSAASTGRRLAGSVLNRAVKQGLVGAEASTFQKVIEAGFAQGMVQALVEVSNLPSYATMEPKERKEAFIRSMVANIAYSAMDLPIIAGHGPSTTQAHMQNRIRLAEYAGKELESALKDKDLDRMLSTAAEMQSIRPESMRPGHMETISRRPPPGGGDGGTPAVDLIDYAPWETEGGTPGTGERENGAVDLPYSADNGPLEPTTNTELVPDNRSVVAVEFPIERIEVDAKLVPQFKDDADPMTGEVRGEQLRAAKYERPSNPIVVWQLNDGRNVVVTGRHRLALAKRLGEKTIPATVVREADGFTRDKAITLDAEFNIRDGNGSVRDYAQYFENTPDLTESDARARGLLDRVKGQAAWNLARNASDDLKTLYRAGRISEGKAVAVARTAPADPAIQRVGMKYADRPEDFIVNVMRAAQAESGGRVEALDLFGADDSAIRQMEQQAQRAASIVRGLRDQVAAVQGAAKRPEVAKRMGVDVSDPNAVIAKIAELKAEIARWDDWPMHPDLVARTRGEPPADPNASRPADDFALKSPTEEELQREKAAKAEKARKQDELDKLDDRVKRPLTGDSSDVGQGKLLSGDEDLLSGPSGQSVVEGKQPSVRGRGDGSSGGGRARASSSKPGLGPSGRPFWTPSSKPTAAPAPAPTNLGGLQHVRAIEFPELVRMAHQLTGAYVKGKKFPRALGMFYPAGPGVVKLNPIVFKDARQAAMTLAHEIGHLADYLPDRAMDRGNLLGRIATLRDFLKKTLPLDPRRQVDEALTPKDRRELRKAAELQAGPKPSKNDPGDLAAWQERVRELYAELRDQAIRDRGLVAEPWIREELLGITRWWKPYDPAEISESQRAYRESGEELYADAISVLFNAPAELQRRAPYFWKTFFSYLDGKPEVKAVVLELQTLLSQGPEAVARQRIAAAKAGYEKAEAVFLDKLRQQQEQRNTFKGWWQKLKLQHVDRGQALLNAEKELRKRGLHIPTRSQARLAWEEGMFGGDNANFKDLRAIFETVVQPLEQAGIDLRTLGAVMEAQREAGNRTAQQELAAIKDRLGDQKMALVESAGELLLKLEASGASEEVIFRRVIAPIEAAGIEFEDVTQVSHLRQIQGSRAEIANPLGHLPQFAQQNLEVMLNDLGQENARLVLDAASKVREIFYGRMLEAAKVGIVPERAMQTIEANKDTYAAFRAVEHVEPWVSPMVKRAYGHSGEIENPFLTTMLKLTALNHLIVEQRAKIASRDMFLQHFPESFAKATTRWTGKGFEAPAPPKGLARLKILENGRPVAYDVDPYIAAAFEKLPSSQLNVATAALDLVFRKGVYPLIIKYNPGFQYVLNPVRDFKRSQRNLGALYGVGRWEFFKRYLRAWDSAKSWAAGEPDKVIEAMMEASAIATPMDTFSHLDRTDPFGELLRRYRLLPERQAPASRVRQAILKPVMGVLNHVEKAGVIREARPKVAAWEALMERGVDPKEAGWAIRTYIGTPNYRVKGVHGNLQNTLIPFSNIFIQGYRADLELAMNARTRGGWWWRWAVGDGSRAMIQAIAASGLMGGWLSELYDGVSEYDKTNYTVIPLGWQTGGEMGRKTVYMRIPRDETSRLVSAVFYKALRAVLGSEDARKLPTEALAFGAGMVPTPSPILEVAGAWWDYVQGQNPVDSFRNSPVVPATEFRAGMRHSLGPMLLWTADQVGALNFIRWNKDANSTFELVTSAIPGINRMFKVSDSGYRAKQYEAMDDEQRAAAISKLEWAPEVRSLLIEYYKLQRLAEKKTPEQLMRFAQLIAWKGMYDAYEGGVEAAELAKDKTAAARYRASLAKETKRMMDVLQANHPAGQLRAPWAKP